MGCTQGTSGKPSATCATIHGDLPPTSSEKISSTDRLKSRAIFRARGRLGLIPILVLAVLSAASPVARAQIEQADPKADEGFATRPKSHDLPQVQQIPHNCSRSSTGYAWISFNLRRSSPLAFKARNASARPAFFGCPKAARTRPGALAMRSATTRSPRRRRCLPLDSLLERQGNQSAFPPVVGYHPIGGTRGGCTMR